MTFRLWKIRLWYMRPLDASLTVCSLQVLLQALMTCLRKQGKVYVNVWIDFFIMTFFSEVYISIRLSSYVNFVYIAHKQSLPFHSVDCLTYQMFPQALKMYQHICVLGSGLWFLMGTHLYVISLVSIGDYKVSSIQFST